MDLARMYHWIVAELARRRPVAESMSLLIDQCEAACPHPNWARLRALPYADLDPLVVWVERLFREEPPPCRSHLNDRDSSVGQMDCAADEATFLEGRDNSRHRGRLDSLDVREHRR